MMCGVLGVVTCNHETRPQLNRFLLPPPVGLLLKRGAERGSWAGGYTEGCFRYNALGWDSLGSVGGAKSRCLEHHVNLVWIDREERNK